MKKAYQAREGLKFEHRYQCNHLDDPDGWKNNVYGVPKVYLEWCQDNCPDKFGWHFETETIFEHEGVYVTVHIGYITFERQEDLVIFKLRHLNG